MLYALLFFIALSFYLAFQYISLLNGLKKISKDILEIENKIEENTILRLPYPNKNLKNLLSAFNKVLDHIRTERRGYEKRERDLQYRIESISHDLRTPLTVILGYLKLYQAKEFKEDETKEIFLLIEKKATIMKSLINNIYDFSRINAGDYRINPEEVDITRFSKEFFLNHYKILEEAGLNLNIEIPDSSIPLSSDQEALERIFLNLFQNASRYATTFFHLSLEKKEKEVLISFKNDSDQLSEEDSSRLFERFFVADKARSTESTGLGLTIAKLLASEIGGELSLSTSSSEKSLILSFELKLPAS